MRVGITVLRTSEWGHVLRSAPIINFRGTVDKRTRKWDEVTVGRFQSPEETHRAVFVMQCIHRLRSAALNVRSWASIAVTLPPTYPFSWGYCETKRKDDKQSPRSSLPRHPRLTHSNRMSRCCMSWSWSENKTVRP
ncbi:hypothetical protein FA13DRAFT_98329 [Coprinellus micaceus]|uniref:Uncharacterized protein n=1 Tax=Coprinellus micaceus TaxID=71717 RepID=A0A4Y7SIF5_COPMI|nr:hypothetical protein FA13DRAFT_98329 [Coprinellus micaceus]